MAKTFSEYYGLSLNYTCCVRSARACVSSFREGFSLLQAAVGTGFSSCYWRIPTEISNAPSNVSSYIFSGSGQVFVCGAVCGFGSWPLSNDAHTLSSWFWSWSRWSFSTALSRFFFLLALVAHLRTVECRNTQRLVLCLRIFWYMTFPVQTKHRLPVQKVEFFQTCLVLLLILLRFLTVKYVVMWSVSAGMCRSF